MDKIREETIEVGGYTITLPIGLEYKPEERRDDYASYLTPEKGLKDVNHHLQALTTLLARSLEDKPMRVLHAFGGLGATAQVIKQVAPRTSHTFWERSATCVKYLRKYWGDVAFVQDSFSFLLQTNLKPFDVVIFDPSLGSILSPGVVEAWDHMAKYPHLQIWVSDMATSKLHLNGKAYAKVFGVETWKPEEYAAAYDQFLRQRGKRIIGATRDNFEMYFMVGPKGRGQGKFIIERLG